MRIQVPNGSDRLSTAKFSADISNIESVRIAEFSFKDVNFVTPGWMLLVLRALREFREKRTGTYCKVTDVDSAAMHYAANAGFFDALGMKWGRKIGDAHDSSTFLPIRVRQVQDIFVDQPFSRRTGDIIQEDADRLSAILAQSRNSILFDTLSYAIREIIRNTVEHSGASEFLMAAQCWLASGTAEIAIADPGIGIAEGLASNGKYKPENDAQALSLAIQPGVSGKVIPYDSDDAWVNSGYGLYMASGLADGEHGFVLASGSAALMCGDGGSEIVDSAINGTCVVLRLCAGATSLERRLSQLVSNTNGSPSRASTSARIRTGME